MFDFIRNCLRCVRYWRAWNRLEHRRANLKFYRENQLAADGLFCISVIPVINDEDVWVGTCIEYYVVWRYLPLTQSVKVIRKRLYCGEAVQLLNQLVGIRTIQERARRLSNPGVLPMPGRIVSGRAFQNKVAQWN